VVIQVYCCPKIGGKGFFPKIWGGPFPDFRGTFPAQFSGEKSLPPLGSFARFRKGLPQLLGKPSPIWGGKLPRWGAFPRPEAAPLYPPASGTHGTGA